jgi:hypothetical protein
VQPNYYCMAVHSRNVPWHLLVIQQSLRGTPHHEVSVVDAKGSDRWLESKPHATIQGVSLWKVRFIVVCEAFKTEISHAWMKTPIY